MDKGILAGILLVVAVIAVYFIVFSGKASTSKEEALQFVMEDLKFQYPNADYEILSAEQIDGSWHIKARATVDAGTPCPERIHANYNYPEFGYVVRKDWITRNCQVCIGVAQDKCLLFFEEEAVIASHNRPGTEDVSTYVLNHPDAVVEASFYNETNGYPPTAPEHYDVWHVQWSSASDGSSLDVLLNRSGGSIIKIWATMPEPAEQPA